MKRGKRIAYVMLAAALLSVSALTPMETKAGNNEILLDGETLTTSEWTNPEKDVVIEEQKLIFPEESTEYTRFIAKTPAKLEELSSALVSLSATIKFSKLPQGKSFIFAYGLSSIESIAGEAGNIEVAFTNNGGIKAGITLYDEEGTEQVIVEPKVCGISLNKAANIKALITTDKKIQLTVNGNTVCSATLPVSGEGRFGFLQTGGCATEISNIELVHYKYERPENTNISEDFEDGAMDVSKLTAKMLWTALGAPMGQYVTEHNGSQVLMHVNTGCAYIGTLYQYSNFEMTFDVPYVGVEKEYKEDGTAVKLGFSKLMVTLGAEKADWETSNWDLSSEIVVLEEGTVYSYNSREVNYAALDKNPFAEGKPFSMQVKMVDSIMTIGMKWLDEENFQTVLQYKLRGGTPTGHLHIWAPTAANFAIDNLKITNLDENPKIIETEYVSGKIEIPEDNVPEELERVYADKKQEGTRWYLLIPVTAAASVSALVITALLLRGKKKESEAK